MNKTREVEFTDHKQRSEALGMRGLIGTKLPVLDKGFVMVTDYMGTDDSIVRRARLSYGKGTRASSSDEALIRYLMRHRHTTPFEGAEIELLVYVPMDTWRQWIRHRTASVNEYSTRYSEAIDERQQTEPHEWRLQSTSNKQGSGDYLEERDMGQAHLLSKIERELHVDAQEVYQQRLDAGVAREQARKDLPLSTYTLASWKIDLHNLLHFLSLRMDAHAQYEIREYANAIGDQIVARWCPMVWQAFLDYDARVGGGVLLSRKDAEALSRLVGQTAGHHLEPDQVQNILARAGFLSETEAKLNREGREFLQKLHKMDIGLAWGNE